MLKKLLLITSFLIGVTGSNSQNPGPDSLYNELKKNQHDTLNAKIYYKIGFHFQKNDRADSSLFHYRRSLALSTKNDYAPYVINPAREIAYYHLDNGDLDSSIFYFNKATAAIKTAHPMYYEIYNGLGIAYFLKGNYIKAYEHYLKALRFSEMQNNELATSHAYTNVGVALKELKKFDDALVFFNKGLDIAIKNNAPSETFISLTNIGNIYSGKYELQKSVYNINMALEYYLKAKEIAMKLLNNEDDKSSAIILLGNIGNIYADQKQYDKALKEYDAALKLMETINYFGSRSLILNNLSTIYIDLKKANEAEKYLKLSKQAAIESGSPDDLMESYKNYARLYELKGDYKKAYHSQGEFKRLSDSLFSTETAEKRKEIELNAEFEKKESLLKAEQEKKEALAKEEKQRQLLLRNAFITGFILMILVAFLIFRSYRIKQKHNVVITQQKLEVEKQKELVEEKQKEILDSILYAKRIQKAHLPSEAYLEKHIDKLKKRGLEAGENCINNRNKNLNV